MKVEWPATGYITMPYLLAPLLDHLPSPLAWVVSDYVDFDESATATLMFARQPNPLVIRDVHPITTTIIDWPELDLTHHIMSSTITIRVTFDRAAGAQSDNIVFWVTFIGLLDITLKNHPAVIESCALCTCRKKC